MKATKQLKTLSKPTIYSESFLVFNYPSKKVLKENIGKSLNYIETSIFGMEYISNGVLTGNGREFFARVTMKDDIIVKVE